MLLARPRELPALPLIEARFGEGGHHADDRQGVGDQVRSVYEIDEDGRDQQPCDGLPLDVQHRASVLRLKAQRGVDRHRQEEEQCAKDDLVFVDLVGLHWRPVVECSADLPGSASGATIGPVGLTVHLVGNREWRVTGGAVLGDVARALASGQCFFALGDSIRARLVMLALVSTAPLLLLAAVNAAQDLTAARQDAQLEALRVAQLHADLIDEHVQSVDTLLRALSTAVSTQPADVALNEELLHGVLQDLPPSYTGLFFSPATGQLPGSGLIFGSSPPSVATGVVLPLRYT